MLKAHHRWLMGNYWQPSQPLWANWSRLYKLKTINLYHASLSTSEHTQPTLPMVSTTVGRYPEVLPADLQHPVVVKCCAWRVVRVGAAFSGDGFANGLKSTGLKNLWGWNSQGPRFTVPSRIFRGNAQTWLLRHLGFWCATGTFAWINGISRLEFRLADGPNCGKTLAGSWT